MDVVWAVSALAMALAVAWADWVMSVVGSVLWPCLSLSWSEKHGNMKNRGELKKMISPEPLVRLFSILHSTFLGDALTVGGTTTSASVPQHHQHLCMYSEGAFWVLEVLDSHFILILYKYGLRIDKWQGKMLPFVFCVHVVPCSLHGCPVYPSLCSQKTKSSLKHESFANHCHHDL